ncbi:capsule biosynthesis GfcC family protein [Halomonas sp. YLGW01]|uniref:capsule biosynthesis GfcC family protein n=1 Tax=Halomonas sp. YLGW01 TaxID=2773308 RepID=UPI00177CF96D|nr:capsule biosynthesis GfcC family protein [Halomonas sp. YLGW01]
MANPAWANESRERHAFIEPATTDSAYSIRVHQFSDLTGTLRDAWLKEPEQPPAPGYAFMLRQEDRQPQQFTARRLLAELDALRSAPKFLDHAETYEVAGLEVWHGQLEKYSDGRLARTPGRADPTSLIARPRHNPALATLEHFGHCRPPNWTEVWHAQGVTRLPFQPGMTVPNAIDTLKDRLPGLSIASDTAWRVSPLGQVNSVGIAAYNHESVELTAGSRVVLPLSSTTIGARWINQTLPRFLATRLPGDDCVLYSFSPLETAKGAASP